MSLLDMLPKLPFLSDNQKKGQYYFALNILPHKVEGAVWGIEGKKLVVVNSAASKYSSEEELIEAGNLALDQALADFPVEPTKILYGVPEHWLQDENLKPEHLKLLRKLSKELDVTPMAFVSSAHAISHLLHKTQGVPLTAILVEITNPLTVSVVKAGKVVGSKAVKRSESLPHDIEKALLGFPEIEVLPSKILVYGDQDVTQYKEELQGFSWMSNLPFLHLPKIEELPHDNSLQAICLAGGSELEPDISYRQQALPVSFEEKKHYSSPMPDEVGDQRSEIRGRRSEVGDQRVQLEDHIEEETDPGSLMGENDPTSLRYAGREDEEGHYPPPPMHQGQQVALSPVDKVKSLVAAPLGALAKSGEGLGRGGSIFGFSKLLVIPILVVVLLAIGFIFLPKADVSVFIDMQNLEKATEVTADPNVTAVDEASSKIPGKIVEASVDGSGTGTATGKKQIGDPAKGSVVIYNKTSSSKSFASGTVLSGPNNIKFSLDSSVQVASQSAVEGGISFGKTTGNATASQIGPEGNLAAGTDLNIEGQSGDNYSAKVDSAFSGGVSKNVTVVTADDQKKLLASLASELRQKAQEELQGQATGDIKVISEGLSEQITKQAFSKKVGDQASDFTLNLTAKYKGTSYSDSDLKQIVSKLAQTNVPDGFELDLSQTETAADVSKLNKDGSLIFNARFKAKLKPKMDVEKIKKDIAGKTPDQAADILKQISNVIGSDIKIKPTLPIRQLQRLPFMAKNINIIVTAK